MALQIGRVHERKPGITISYGATTHHRRQLRSALALSLLNVDRLQLRREGEGEEKKENDAEEEEAELAAEEEDARHGE